MTVHLVATDLDGTFIATDHSVRDDTIETYHKLAEDPSINVVVCTGRAMPTARTALKQIRPDFNLRMFPGIYYHGAIAYGKDEEDIIYTEYLNKEVVRKIVDELYRLQDDVLATHYNTHNLSNPCELLQFSSESMITDFDTYIITIYKTCGLIVDFVTSVSFYMLSGIHQSFEHFCSVYEERYDQCLNRKFVEDDLEEVFHISIIAHPCLLEQLRRKMTAFLDETGLNLRIIVPAAECIHFLNNDVSKGKALEALSRIYNWHPDTTLAIGDSDNDIEMLKWARYSVAMGDGSPSVKQVARYETDHSTRGGWAMAVSHLVFKKEEGPICANGETETIDF